MTANKKHGFIIAEMVTAGFLLLVVLGSFMFALGAYSRFNAVQFARQRCIAAAQAQLDSFSATGSPLSAAEAAKLWPDVKIDVNFDRPRWGQWKGMHLVTVDATAEHKGKTAAVKMSRYIR
jgi:hypothetical protein